MGTPGNSQGAFGIGGLIDQFKGRAREVLQQANAGLDPVRSQLQALNEQGQKAHQFIREKQEELRQGVRQGLRQIDRGLDPIHEPLMQANRAMKETQSQVAQHQRELPGRLQKAASDIGAELHRKDAGKAFLESDGTNVFKPVFDAGRAAYEASPAYKAQHLYEEGKKEAGKRVGEGFHQFVDQHHEQIQQAQQFVHDRQKEAGEHFREGLRRASPTLEAIDRSLPFKEQLQQTSHAINEERKQIHQQIHHAMWDPCPDWMQSVHNISKAKADHAKFYAEQSGVKTIAEDVQDVDTVHSLGKGAVGTYNLLRNPEGRQAVLKLIKQPEEAWRQAVSKEHAAPHEPRPTPPETAPAAPGSRGGRAELDAWHIDRLERLNEEAERVAQATRLRATETANQIMEGANAGGRKNCTVCCMATYDRMHGVAPTVALPRPLAQAVHDVHGVEDAAGRFLQQEGNSGWLQYTRPDGSIHEIHAARVNGEVVLSQMPSGGRAYAPHELEGMRDFKFKPTGEKLAVESAATHGDRAILESYFNHSFEPVGSVREAEAQYLRNPGSSGVLWYHDPPPGNFSHVINVANVDGHVMLMDTQANRLLRVEDLEGRGYQYKFLPTDPPVGYEGIPPHGHMPEGPTVRARARDVPAAAHEARPPEPPASHESLPSHGGGGAPRTALRSPDAPAGHEAFPQHGGSLHDPGDPHVPATPAAKQAGMPSPDAPAGHEGLPSHNAGPRDPGDPHVPATPAAKQAGMPSPDAPAGHEGLPPHNAGPREPGGPHITAPPETLHPGAHPPDAPAGHEGLPPHNAGPREPGDPHVPATPAAKQAGTPSPDAPAGHEGLPSHGAGPRDPGGPHVPPEPPRPFGMRPQDEEVFAEAARREGRWIVVRETNPEALKYIGEPGYTPKPFECKAKSANMAGNEYAGLVVSPHEHPHAFKDPAAAIEEWDKMMAKKPGNFEVDPQGRLRIDGKLVHSDYDVYDVIDPKRPRGNLSPVDLQNGEPVFKTRGLPPIKDYVNEQIGSPVIQHPGEAQFKEHSDQRLIVFGPDGQRFVTDGKQAIEDVYNQRFQGRGALDQSRFDPDKVVPEGPPKLSVVRETEPRPPAGHPEPPAPGAGAHDPLSEPLSRDELWRQGVQSQRGFLSSPGNRPGDAARPGLDDALRKEPSTVAIDPQGVGPRVGKGYETFGAVQVLDKDGRRVDVGAGNYQGGGPENHAEAQAIGALEKNGPARVDSGKMMVVVEKDPCDHCQGKILDYAQSRGLKEVEVHVPSRQSLKDPDDYVTGKQAAATSFQGGRPPLEWDTVRMTSSGEVLERSGPRARESAETEAAAQKGQEQTDQKAQPAAPRADERVDGHAIDKGPRSRDLGEDPRRHDTGREKPDQHAVSRGSKSRDLGEDPHRQQEPPREAPERHVTDKPPKSRDLGEDPHRQQEPPREAPERHVTDKPPKSRDLGEDPRRPQEPPSEQPDKHVIGQRSRARDLGEQTHRQEPLHAQPDQHVTSRHQSDQHFTPHSQPDQHAAPREQSDQPITPREQPDQHVTPHPQSDQHAAPRQQSDQLITPREQPDQHVTPHPQSDQHAAPRQESDQPITPREQPDQHVTPRPQTDQQATPREQPDQHVTPRPQTDQQAAPREQPDQHVTPHPQTVQHATPREQSDQHLTPRQQSDQPITPRQQSEQHATPRPQPDQHAAPRQQSDPHRTGQDPAPKKPAAEPGHPPPDPHGAGKPSKGGDPGHSSGPQPQQGSDGASRRGGQLSPEERRAALDSMRRKSGRDEPPPRQKDQPPAKSNPRS